MYRAAVVLAMAAQLTTVDVRTAERTADLQGQQLCSTNRLSLNDCLAVRDGKEPALLWFCSVRVRGSSIRVLKIYCSLHYLQEARFHFCFLVLQRISVKISLVLLLVE